jgi:hypothetical protein
MKMTHRIPFIGPSLATSTNKYPGNMNNALILMESAALYMMNERIEEPYCSEYMNKTKSNPIQESLKHLDIMASRAANFNSKSHIIESE